jgi:hypothetical protein
MRLRGFRESSDERPELSSLLAIAHEVCRRRGGYQRLVEADFLAAEERLTAADVRRAAVETLLFGARQTFREELDGSLTCHEAELAVSRRLDDRLSLPERRLLAAHLRSCEACDGFAQRQHAQRAALRALAEIPLPDTLRSLLPRPATTASFLSHGRLLR